MTTIRVTVLREGLPASGYPVSLEVNHPNAGGVLTEEITDGSGIAEFDVDEGLDGDIYVDGCNEGHWDCATPDITIDLE